MVNPETLAAARRLVDHAPPLVPAARDALASILRPSAPLGGVVVPTRRPRPDCPEQPAPHQPDTAEGGDGEHPRP